MSISERSFVYSTRLGVLGGADAPSKPATNDSTNTNKGESDKNAVATTPVEESKGKPKIAE